MDYQGSAVLLILLFNRNTIQILSKTIPNLKICFTNFSFSLSNEEACYKPATAGAFLKLKMYEVNPPKYPCNVLDFLVL